MGRLQGDVSTISIADLVQYLSQNEKEGTLTLQQGLQKKQIFIGRRGMRLLLTTTQRKNPLGEILIRTKKITRKQLDAFLLEQKRTGKKLGEIVGSLGLVSKGDIARALREQVEEEIYEVFTWFDATFEFVEGPLPARSASPFADPVLEANPTTIMLEAARRADEMHMIMRTIRSDQMIPQRTTRPFRANGESDEVAEVLYAQIDGRATIREIISESLYPRFEALRALYVLVEEHCIRLFEREETVQDSQPPPVATPAPAPPPVPSPTAASRKTVLIIGAMPKFRSALSNLLHEEGYHVLEESTDRALPAMADHAAVDAVILDIGITLANPTLYARRIAQNTSAPLIVLASDRRPEFGRAMTAAGVHCYLVKPLSSRTLLDALKQILAATASRSSARAPTRSRKTASTKSFRPT
ncbi:MAG: DUF4388 domain-containing protein [Planctomycetes bacterium]|nr:DUF4388 domain-containing protein [Planctomycetota bacterium]